MSYDKIILYKRGINALKIHKYQFSINESILTVDEKSIDLKTISKVKLNVMYTRYEGALWIYTFMADFANEKEQLHIEFNDMDNKMPLATCQEIWSELLDVFWKHAGLKMIDQAEAELKKTGTLEVTNKIKFTTQGIEKTKRTLFGKKTKMYAYDTITNELSNYTSILKYNGQKIGQLFFGSNWNSIVYNSLLSRILQKNEISI